MAEMPEIRSVAYTSNSSGGPSYGLTAERAWRDPPFAQADLLQQVMAERRPQTTDEKEEETDMPENSRRIVKVFVVDPDENVPVENCLLYEGEEHLTESTDEELFFEMDIKDRLSKHNEYRKTVRDKDVKEREEFLEPVRIRDLRMTVVTVASF